MNTSYTMGDIGRATFSVFFMQSASFLAHQRQFEAGHGRSNFASLFAGGNVPSDNHIRDMLDPADPALLHPMFAGAFDQLRRAPGGLDTFRRLGGRLLIALDGTEYHCSNRDPLPEMLAATLVAPGHEKVLPLELVFIVPQDGSEKQDCENMAAKRWLALHGRRYADLGAVYLGDDLFPASRSARP